MLNHLLSVVSLCALTLLADSLAAQQPPAALQGHTNAVSDAVYSPDGKLIATSSFDGTVKIWDSTTGDELRSLTGHAGQVLSLAVSADGRQLASGGRDNSVKLWDFYIPTPLSQLTAHEGGVTCCRVGADGAWWVTGGADQLAKIWDPAAPEKPLFELSGHSATVTTLTVNGDSTQVATADAEGGVRLWNPADGTAMGILGGGTSPIVALQYRPSAEAPQLLTAEDNGSVKLWELPLKDAVPLAGHTEAVTAVAMSADGSLVATGGADASVRLFTPGEDAPPRVLEGQPGPVTSIALNTESGLIASASDTGIMKLWSVADGEDRLSLSGHTGPVHDVAISPKGDMLATAGEDGTLRLWKLPLPATTLAGHTMPVASVSVSNDGKQIVTAGADKLLKVFDAATGDASPSITVSAAASASALNADNSQLATGDIAGELHLWNTADGVTAGSVAGHVGSITFVSYLPEGKQLLSAGDDGPLHWWNLPFVAPGQLPEAAAPVNRLALFPDEKQVVFGSTDGAIRIVSTETAQAVRALVGHDGEIHSLAASPTHVASGDAAGNIRIWNAADGTALPTIAGHTGKVTDLAFDAKGTQLISAGEDGTLRAWNLPMPIKSLAGVALPVDVAAFSADGTLVASAGMSGGKPTIIIRETATGKVNATLLGHEAAISSLAFSADKTKLISGAADKTARVWNLADAKFPELAKFEGHAAAVSAVVFSADGAQAFSAAGAGELKQWNVADAAEIRALAGHTGAVVSLAVAGNTLVSGSADQSVRLWNVANGQAIRNIAHDTAVTAVAVSKDGKLIAAAGADKSVKLYNAADGAELAPIPATANVVTYLAISVDATRVAGVAAGTLYVWNATGQPIERFPLDDPLQAATFGADNATLLSVDSKHVLQTATSSLAQLIAAHEMEITSLALLPAGTSAVTASADKTVKLWNLADGKTLATFAGPTDVVSDISLSADGKLLAGVSVDKTNYVWPVPAAAAAQPIAAQTKVTTDWAASSIALSPDGMRLAIAGEVAEASTVVQLWDLASGRIAQQFTGHTGAVTDIAMLSDGKVLTVSSDKTARIWTPAIARVVVAVEGKIIDASLSSDGVLLAIAGDDKQLRLVNVVDGTIAAEIPTAAATPSSVSLRGDKTQLAAGTDDKKLHLWPLTDGKAGAVISLDVPDVLPCVRFNAEGTRIAASCVDKSLLVFDAVDGLLLERSPLPDVPGKLAVSPDGTSVVATLANNVHVQPLSLIQVLRGHEGAATAVAFLPDATALISGGADKTLRQWTLADGAQARTFSGATDAIVDLGIATDGSQLVAASADNFARLWPLAPGGAAVEATAAIEHAVAVHGVDISSDGTRVATSAGDGVVRVWDAATTRELQHFNAHEMPALAVSLSADGTTVVSGSADKNAMLSSVAAQRVFVADPVKVTDAAFLPDGSAIAVTGSEAMIKLFNLKGKPLRQSAAAPGPLAALAIRGDGMQLAAADAEGRVLLFNAADGALQQTIETGAAAGELHFGPEHQKLVVAGADNHLRVYSTADAALLQDQTAAAPIASAQFLPGGREILTGTADGALSLFAYASPVPVAELTEHTSPVYSLAYSSDGKWLASAGGDQTVRIYDRSTGQTVRQLAEHAGAVYAVGFSADAAQVVTAGVDGAVRLWNAETGAAIRAIAPELAEGESPQACYDAALSTDGKLIAAASADRTIRVYNAASGQPGPVIQSQDDAVYQLQFLPGGQLLSIGHAGNLTLWNPADGSEVFTTKAQGVAYSVCPSPTSKQVAVPSADGKTYLITLP